MPEQPVLRTMPAGAIELGDQLHRAVAEMASWMREYGDVAAHSSQDVPLSELEAATAELRHRLRDNYPFHHPRYAGQMLKPPHPAAVIGYVTAMLVNPNNHALDGGPATAAMEKDVVGQLAAMFGFPEAPGHLGHLTSSGTIANLEALFVARETHPGKAIAHSADAHYTHARMAHLLGIEAVAVPTTADGTMDLDALDAVLGQGRVGTVVATTGTTGPGAVDPVHEIVPIARRHGVRVHVDAAYGGFFRLIADDQPGGVVAAPYLAIADCDSVVLDPHKHGLQPYGCGAVLFRDAGVAQHYLHDSPYTYFTSDDLHLGEISIECSRAGAAAAALWLTLRLLPLTADGLGAVLRPGRQAALDWAARIEAGDELRLYQPPQLDIVAYFPNRQRLSEVDAASAAALAAGMARPPAESLHLATYTVDGPALAARGHHLDLDVPTGQILRSVLMKPEHEAAVPELHRGLLGLVGRG
ncbi:aminotransferase class I/II-fold pyridoxal phosphate-dependent enzyme [Nocardioides sp. HM23]|uniref:pyridoxal phosphate-dependent decarboxylase family protein n=1 Tax=Nocardioides bizhenqiangii TaxID=3095076 RepID=UPI002ACAFC65|nr:aminotransferase class I/II-fold pyridoxal phosphate-dependent enzyme [Nocardioides sp. HM23]MDZ5620917.1 aminotransferase class I/II-fold pyridoxal phosphate-dependent enzyme [Nocardioides sp. HM23]